MANRFDNFTRADGTLNGSTPDDGGSAWVCSPTNGYSISSNAITTSVTGTAFAYLESSAKDADVQATLTATGGNPSILFRLSDTSNYLYCYAIGNFIHLNKVVAGGAPVEIGHNDVTAIAPGDVIKVSFSGSSITVYKNGTALSGLTAIVDGFNSTATKHGFFNDNSGNGAKWDTLTITDTGIPGLTAGTLAAGTPVTPTSVPFTLTAASGGTSPYQYQLQRVPTGAGFGSPTVIATHTGQTSTDTFTDSTVAGGTTYDYRVVVTDSTSATANSNTLTVAVPVAATSFAFTGPSGGASGAASTNFSLTPNGYVSAATVALSDGGGGGTFTPSSLTFTSTTAAGHFTYTPGSAGTKTLTPSTSSGAPSTYSPASLNYLSSVKSWIQFIGDSLTMGSHATSPGTGAIPFAAASGTCYPGVVIASLGSANWAGENAGGSGWSIVDYSGGALPYSDLNSDLSRWVHANFSASRPVNIALIQIGTNDVNHDVGATVYANLTSYLAAIRSAESRWKIGVATIPPNGTNEARREALNTLIVANTAGADFVVDYTSDPHIGVPTACTNTTWFFTDQIHMLDPGYGKLAAYMLGAVVALKPSVAGGGGLRVLNFGGGF